MLCLTIILKSILQSKRKLNSQWG